jgi:hypothetical protein
VNFAWPQLGFHHHHARYSAPSRHPGGAALHFFEKGGPRGTALHCFRPTRGLGRRRSRELDGGAGVPSCCALVRTEAANNVSDGSKADIRSVLSPKPLVLTQCFPDGRTKAASLSDLMIGD